MSGDMEKIIEISLAKIENTKTQKINGKSNILHRNLLVNTLLNRVRSTDKNLQVKKPLMNYREPKNMVDIDMEDYDMDKVPSSKDFKKLNQPQQQQTQHKIVSSLVAKLNSRSLAGKTESSLCNDILISDDISEQKETKKEDIFCECKLKNITPKLRKKRIHSTESDDQSCPSKKLRSIWPSNVSPKAQELGYSVTNLASLFGGLVANTDSEMATLNFGNKFVSAMVAC